MASSRTRRRSALSPQPPSVRPASAGLPPEQLPDLTSVATLAAGLQQAEAGRRSPAVRARALGLSSSGADPGPPSPSLAALRLAGAEPGPRGRGAAGAGPDSPVTPGGLAAGRGGAATPRRNPLLQSHGAAEAHPPGPGGVSLEEIHAEMPQTSPFAAAQ
jgi:hypothetical protein